VSGKTYTATSTTDYTMVPDSKIELAFGADGTLAVSAGCNNMSSSYTIEGDVLKVPVFAATLKACDDPLMAQDKWVSDLLTSNPTIAAADDDGIVITGKSGSMTLQIK
jgi:heat shock protein HslJ